MRIETDIVVNLNPAELNALSNVYNMLADLSIEEEQQLTKRLNRDVPPHSSIQNVRRYLYDLYELAGGDTRNLID